MNDKTQLSFDEQPLSQVPFEDLTEAGLARDAYFGGSETAGEIDYRRLKISIGNRPLSWRLAATPLSAAAHSPKVAGD